MSKSLSFLESINISWIFVLVTLIVVVIMDDYNVERKVLNLAIFTPKHTISNRTLLTRIILGRKRIHSISLKTIHRVVVLALIRGLDCVLLGIVGGPSFALTVDFALFSETHSTVLIPLVNVFVLALL